MNLGRFDNEIDAGEQYGKWAMKLRHTPLNFDYEDWEVNDFFMEFEDKKHLMEKIFQIKKTIPVGLKKFVLKIKKLCCPDILLNKKNLN